MKMDKYTLDSLANELQFSRDRWEHWSKQDQMDKSTNTEWSDVAHHEYGEASGWYSAVDRIFRLLDIKDLVEEVITDREAQRQLDENEWIEGAEEFHAGL
tara:strand:+ start:649 stop:948 length:300 start_codon:yes stop_codon:yes gene_type:complete